MEKKNWLFTVNNMCLNQCNFIGVIGNRFAKGDTWIVWKRDESAENAIGIIIFQFDEVNLIFNLFVT